MTLTTQALTIFLILWVSTASDICNVWLLIYYWSICVNFGTSLRSLRSATSSWIIFWVGASINVNFIPPEKWLQTVGKRGAWLTAWVRWRCLPPPAHTHIHTWKELGLWFTVRALMPSLWYISRSPKVNERKKNGGITTVLSQPQTISLHLFWFCLVQEGNLGFRPHWERQTSRLSHISLTPVVSWLLTCLWIDLTSLVDCWNGLNF